MIVMIIMEFHSQYVFVMYKIVASSNTRIEYKIPLVIYVCSKFTAFKQSIKINID